MKTALLSLPKGALGGNRTTALRWAKILRELGWDVVRAAERDIDEAQLITALHAVHTRAEVERLLKQHPQAKLVVACTGTDIYEAHADSQVLLDWADKIIVLQDRALDELTEDQRARARVVYQSTPPLEAPPSPPTDHLRIALIANVRAVKDPLLAARAARSLPESSRLQLVHLGAAIDPDLTEEVKRESSECPRYEWRGHGSRLEALTLLASSHAAVLPSVNEGGANLITEAFAMGTALIASDIPGNVGLLGEDHPALFPSGDTVALAALFTRLEREDGFLETLSARSRERAWISAPSRERESWEELLGELFSETKTP
jgi:putative glycosyltransferase (TIGR04348 family)